MIKRIVLMGVVSTLIYPVHGSAQQRPTGSWIAPVAITLAVVSAAYTLYRIYLGNKDTSKATTANTSAPARKRGLRLPLRGRQRPTTNSVDQTQQTTTDSNATLERLQREGKLQPTVFTAAQTKEVSKPVEQNNQAVIAQAEQPTAKKPSVLERLKAAGIAQPTVMIAAQSK